MQEKREKEFIIYIYIIFIDVFVNFNFSLRKKNCIIAKKVRKFHLYDDHVNKFCSFTTDFPIFLSLSLFFSFRI